MVTNEERKKAATLCRKFAMTGTFFGPGALVEVVDVSFPFNGTCWTKLANLIDPDVIPDNTDELERKLSEPEIDRDALLALAEEIDRKSNDGTVNPEPTRPIASSLDLFGYAQRIREAVGA